MITVKGKRHAWREGMTVADLLREIDDSHTYPVVRINDRYVSRSNFDQTPIPDECEVFLIPMIAGG
jgi:thiamine biosynthesis protein ThiS